MCVGLAVASDTLDTPRTWKIREQRARNQAWYWAHQVELHEQYPLGTYLAIVDERVFAAGEWFAGVHGESMRLVTDAIVKDHSVLSDHNKFVKYLNTIFKLGDVDWDDSQESTGALGYIPTRKTQGA